MSKNGIADICFTYEATKYTCVAHDYGSTALSSFSLFFDGRPVTYVVDSYQPSKLFFRFASESA